MYCRVFFIAFIFLTGCTSQLWKTPNYHERITGYYGVKDKDLLIVTGEQFSYVFEASEQFKSVLAESRKTEFSPRYEAFRLNEDNTVTGVLTLFVYKPQDVARLAKLGFKKDKSGNMKIDFQLKGKRYKVEGNFPFEQLEDEHFVRVETPESGIAKAGKIIATPATVTIDAIAVIPVGAMFALLGVVTALDL